MVQGAKIQPEIEYEDGVPLVPNVSPVLILKGSDYEIGYQYSIQLHEVFGPWVLERLKRSFTDEEIVALKAYHIQIEKYAPEFLNQLNGRVDGAKACGIEVSYLEFLYEACRTVMSRVLTYPGREPDEANDDALFAQKILPEGCSGMAAWGKATKDGKLICAASSDHSIYHTATAIIYPDEGNSYIYPIIIPQIPGIHPAMNSKGLVFVHHAQPIYGDEPEGYGLPGTIHQQHTLRFADNVAEALSMQRSYPQGIKAGGLWADVSGDALALECRTPYSMRKSGDYGEEDFIYASNTVLSRDLEPYMAAGVGHSLGWPTTYTEHGGWNQDDLNSVRRNLYMWNVLHNYRGSVDFEFMKMLWRQPSKAPDNPNLEQAEADLNKTLGAGWDSYIGNLGTCFMAIMQPDDGGKGLYHVCLGAPGRKAEPLTQKVYFFPIDPLRVFVEVQLADTPADVAKAAQKRAQYDLYYANKELGKLSYGDIPFAPLSEIFEKAAKANQKGEFFLDAAGKADDKEAIRLYAKATRYFARSQAYAKHVFESLVLQPESPAEMGLPEWMGAWGEWGTVESCNEA